MSTSQDGTATQDIDYTDLSFMKEAIRPLFFLY